MTRRVASVLLIFQMLLVIMQTYPVVAESSDHQGLLAIEPDMSTRAEYASNKVQSQVTDFMNRDWNEVQWLPASVGGSPEYIQPEVPLEPPPVPEITNMTGVDEPVILFDRYQSSRTRQSVDSSSVPSLADRSDSEGVFGINPSYYPYSETNSFPAPIMPPTKDCNWFPKKSYSVLAFEYNNDGLCYLEFWIDVVRDQDVYLRYLTVYHDGTVILHVIIGSAGYHGAVALGWILGGNHKLEVEVNYCAWKDHQWKLTYAQPFISHFSGEHEPIYDFWEYFPSGSYPTLEWQVQAGFDSYIHLETEVLSGSSHAIQFYINGDYRGSVSSGTAQAFILGSYADDEVLIVKLRLYTSSEEYYGTRLKYFTISHDVITLEIDWMGESNGNPLVPLDDLTTMAEYVRSYYILHGYARVDYYVGNWVLQHTYMSPDDFEYYRSENYHHAGDDMYEWVLIAKYGESPYDDYLGWHYDDGVTDWGIAVFASLCETLNYMRLVLLHEVGHHAGIIELDDEGYEVPCGNSHCCMSDGSDLNAVPAPWYCIKHWSLREYPFTPQG